MDHSYLSCCLNAKHIPYQIDAPADAFNEADMECYGVMWSVPCRPYNCFGIMMDTQNYATGVDVVHTTDGKYAYPVYKVTPIYDEFGDSDEGTIELAGWCIKDSDQFSDCERRDDLHARITQ